MFLFHSFVASHHLQFKTDPVTQLIEFVGYLLNVLFVTKWLGFHEIRHETCIDQCRQNFCFKCFSMICKIRHNRVHRVCKRFFWMNLQPELEFWYIRIAVFTRVIIFCITICSIVCSDRINILHVFPHQQTDIF